MAFSKQAYNKNQLLSALEKSLGIVTSACKMCNLEPKTYYNYLKDDTEFAAKVESIQETVCDFVETQLLKNIKDGNTAEILFYLKTKGRKRGYVEKQELDLTSKGESIKQTTYIIKDANQKKLLDDI